MFLASSLARSRNGPETRGGELARGAERDANVPSPDVEAARNAVEHIEPTQQEAAGDELLRDDGGAQGEACLP